MIRIDGIFGKAVFLAIVALAVCCSKDPAGPGPAVTASEVWRLNDIGTQNYSDLTFSKYENGSVLVNGKWCYNFYGNWITCAFMNGSAIIADSAVSIAATGTASYPPDSTGQAETSAFNLTMKGSFKNGASRGTWEIHFADTLWEDWVKPGIFTGTLQSGSGVTADEYRVYGCIELRLFGKIQSI